MQTSLLLPLILIATNGPGVPSDHRTDGTHHAFQSQGHSYLATRQMVSHAQPENTKAHVAEIFDGCRAPVLDPREASKILFQNRVDDLHEVLKSDLPDTGNTPLFIARCGSEFVLFHRRPAEDPGDTLYLRFEEGSFALLGEAWG
ncbi:MAG: hypothetical protein AAFZ04_14740 [Pseudomonadota bacterium]